MQLPANKTPRFANSLASGGLNLTSPGAYLRSYLHLGCAACHLSALGLNANLSRRKTNEGCRGHVSLPDWEGAHLRPRESRRNKRNKRLLSSFVTMVFTSERSISMGPLSCTGRNGPSCVLVRKVLVSPKWPRLRRFSSQVWADSTSVCMCL